MVTAKFDTLLTELASAIPELVALDLKVKDQWSPEAPPATLHMIEIAHAVAKNATELSSDQLRRFFASIESALMNGEQDIKDVIATGFLEALLAKSSAGCLDFAVLIPFLGPATRSYCCAWDEFTGVDTPGL